MSCASALFLGVGFLGMSDIGAITSKEKIKKGPQTSLADVRTESARPHIQLPNAEAGGPLRSHASVDCCRSAPATQSNFTTLAVLDADPEAWPLFSAYGQGGGVLEPAKSLGAHLQRPF